MHHNGQSYLESYWFLEQFFYQEDALQQYLGYFFVLFVSLLSHFWLIHLFYLHLLYQPYVGLCQATRVQSHQRQSTSAVAIATIIEYHIEISRDNTFGIIIRKLRSYVLNTFQECEFACIIIGAINIDDHIWLIIMVKGYTKDSFLIYFYFLINNFKFGVK